MRILLRTRANRKAMAGIVSEDRATAEEALKKLLDQENGCSAELCRDLLTSLDTHPSLQTKVAEVIAAFSREENFRDLAVSCGVVPRLCPLLASQDRQTQLHTLRAIGNLCIDHDGNRELVLSNGGCPLLVELLKSSSQLPVEKEFDRLKCVSCGCLLNVVNDNDKLCQEMLGLGAVGHLSVLLGRPGEDESTISMGLKALYVLLAAGASEPKLLSPSSLSQAFSHLLGQCVSGELSDQLQSLLETVEVAVNANDEVKVAVVGAGCVEKLTQIPEPSLQMKAIDLLILISANDESLKLLSTQSELVKSLVNWLSESTPLKQRANAALLLANMARTDEMCELFISRGVVSLLISLTLTEEPEELSGKVRVSALSALRNLCIPVSHKTGLVEKGVLETALRCLRDDKWPHVHFKCLGIARLLVSLQEVCRELGKPGTVALICERCSSAEPAHVKIEGSRLLAGLVKHCQSEEVMRVVISEGGVKLIASLLDSAHLSLRNEALVAVNLLAVMREGEEVGAALTEEVVVGGVWGVVSASDSSPELVSNALTFLVQLTDRVGVREKLVAMEEMAEKLGSLTQNGSPAVCDLARQLAKNLSLNQS